MSAATAPATERRALGGAIAACVALAALFLFATQPQIRKAELWEAAAWGVLLVCSFVGWGTALERLALRERRADPGLRAIWGASALAFVGGVLSATSLFSRGAGVLLVNAGVIAFGVFVFRDRAALAERARIALRVARANVAMSTLLGVALFGIALGFLGSIADPRSNPYDDDVAYLGLVKRLVQTGTLIEPFSFRRLSALGGQTFFLALTSLHASYRQLNLFDRGVGFVLVALLILGHRAGRRRVPLALTVLLLVFLVTLPNTSINTAAHVAGFAFFLGLFRTLAWMDEERDAVRGAIPLALVAAATCTLRQNYLSGPTAMLAIVYGTRLFRKDARRAPWTARLREPLLVAGVALIALLPWLVLAWRSNDTFLFPLQPGTYRRAMALQSPTFTALKELRFLFAVGLENEPIRVLSAIVLAGAIVRDDHPYKPLRSLWFGSAFSVLFLSHAFTLSDPGTLGRYLFGPLSALATATVLTVGTQPLRDLRTRAAIVLSVGAMLVQIPHSREKATKSYATMFGDIDLARRRPAPSGATAPPAQHLYEHVQSSVPGGAALAVMVDDAYYVDYARNPIFNIDMPGFSSLKPDMPFFEGSEKVAEYFLAHGIRYVMYVRPEHSHWLYQREFWFRRMFNEEEIWRLIAPYFVDFIDSLTALRESRKVVVEEAGIVVLDLAERR